MNFSDSIIEEYNIIADKRVASACRIMIGFMTIVGLLNMVGIFKIDKVPLYTTVILSSLNFFLPTFMYEILKIHKNWSRYFVLFMLVLQSGLQYSCLSYHVIMMLLFPLVISCLYNSKRYVIFAAALSYPMIVVSHMIAYVLHVVPDEPLVTMKGTVLFGVIPRFIQEMAFVVVCYYIATRIQSLIKQLTEKNQELYDDQEAVLTSLSEIIEYQSEHTGKHVKRVAEYTAVLCRGLGYSEEETWMVSQASKMHDVGKIMIPLDILEKPERLTNEEFEIVKRHTLHGKQMLERAQGELLKIASIIAYEHHERWDGKGYIGIKGEDINPYARCVALADVYDALVAKRPYKDPWSAEAIHDEIIRQRGKQFAPEVVDTFLKHEGEFKKITEENPD